MARITHDDTNNLSGEPQQDNQTVIQADQSGNITLPSGDFLASANYTQDGQDLVIEGPDGSVIIVESYFVTEPQPQLTSPEGGQLSPELVQSFVKPAGPLEFAQNAGASDASPVGMTTEVSGNATVTRTDGTVESVTIGTPIFQGDIVETDAEGAINIVFADESSFAISEDARLAIDEFVYDPSTSEGTSDFSILRGVFVYTSGLIGQENPDSVELETPVGSIGIRGTIIGGNINPAGTDSQITVVEGAIVVRNGAGEMTLTSQFETLQLNSFDAPPVNVGVMDIGTFSDNFSSVRGVAGTFFNSIDAGPNDNADNANGDDSGNDNNSNDTTDDADSEDSGNDAEASGDDSGDSAGEDGANANDAQGEGDDTQTEDTGNDTDLDASADDGTTDTQSTDTQSTDSGSSDNNTAGTDDGTGDDNTAGDSSSTDERSGEDSTATGDNTTQTADSTTTTTTTTTTNAAPGSGSTTSGTTGTTSTTPSTNTTGTSSTGTSGSETGNTGTSGNDSTNTTTTTDPITVESLRPVINIVNLPTENALTPGLVIGFIEPQRGATPGAVFELVGGPVAAFNLNPQTGELSLSGNTAGAGNLIDFETNPLLSLEVRVTHNNKTITDTLRIDVQDSIDSPEDVTTNTLQIAEDTNPGDLVTILGGDDDDTADANLTFTITNNPDGIFEIQNGNELRIKSGVTLDFEGQNFHDVTIKAVDPEGNFVEKSLTFDVLDVNEAPTDFKFQQPNLQAPIRSNGAFIAELGVIDQDTAPENRDFNIDITAIGIDTDLDGTVDLDFQGGGTPTMVDNNGDGVLGVDLDGDGSEDLLVTEIIFPNGDTTSALKLREGFSLGNYDSGTKFFVNYEDDQTGGDTALDMASLHIDMSLDDGTGPITLLGKFSADFGGISVDGLSGSNGFQILDGQLNFDGSSQGRLGFSVFSDFDLNGDGTDDFVIGDVHNNRAFVIYGDQDADYGPALNVRDAIANGTAFEIDGTVLGASKFGERVTSVGDIDGDGYDDVLISSPSDNVVTLVRGGATPGLPITFDFTGLSLAATDMAGMAISAIGDFNSDGYDDFAIGIPDAGDGKTAVVFGGDVFDGTTNPTITFGFSAQDVILSGSDGFMINAQPSKSGALNQFGHSIDSIGDFNGDGFEDFIVGAPGSEDQGDTQSDEGAAYIFFGSDTPTVPALQDDSTKSADFLRLESDLAGFAVGFSVAGGGDFNNDGYDDVIIASPTANGNDGKVYVVYGSMNAATDPTIGLFGMTTEGIFITPPTVTPMQLGHSIDFIGDFNGDGFDDILLGAPGNIAGNPLAYVVYGSDTPGDISDINALNSNQVYEIHGPNDMKGGLSVSAAGDVNGDGFDDIIIGAPEDDVDDFNTDDEGSAFVIYGGAFDDNVFRTVGGDGDDSLSAASANEILIGGLGNDSFDISAALTGILMVGADGDDTFDDGGNAQDAWEVEGGAGDDIILISNGSANDFDNEFDGGDGLDVIQINDVGGIIDWRSANSPFIDSIETIGINQTGAATLNLDFDSIIRLGTDINAANVTINDIGPGAVILDIDLSSSSFAIQSAGAVLNIGGIDFVEYSDGADSLFIEATGTSTPGDHDSDGFVTAFTALNGSTDALETLLIDANIAITTS